MFRPEKTLEGVKITVFASPQGRPGQALLMVHQISILPFLAS